MITTGTLFPHSDRTVILASAGAGKGLPVTSKILTRNGFIQLKDLQLYDKVISPVDGKEYPVTGIYNRGYRHVNKITFTNRTSVLFDDDHLWAIQSGADRYAGKPFTVVTAEELKNTPLHRQAGKWRKHLVFIPVSCPVEFSDEDLPMPYALGLFISDGCTVNRSIVIAEKDVKRKFEVEIKECGGYLKPLKKKYNYYIKNFSMFQDKFSFFGTHSYNKFIPKEYLYASLDTRRKLLAGLIDGDGTVSSSGKIDFDSTSAQLIEDITFLVSSLGGVVTKRKEKTGKYKKDGCTVICRTVYRINFWLPEGVVLSEKHTRRLNFCAKQRNQYKAVESIEDAGYADCMCIYIDSPDHLFITDDWIVTHNTSRLMDILGEQLVTTDSSRIAFVTFTRKGVSEGISRVLKKYPFLSYEQLPFFRTLHSLCFRELKLDRNRLWGIKHEKLLNASIGCNVHRFYDIDHATRDNQILDAYDIERSGGRADPNIVCTPEYERLTKAYDEVKKQTGAIDFTDCLQMFVEQGKSLPVDVACIDECFSPETKVRMADGSVKEIKHINVGDTVQGTKGPTTVIAKHEGIDDMYNVVSCKNEVLFTCNSRHALISPFSDSWEEAQNLEITKVYFQEFGGEEKPPLLKRKQSIVEYTQDFVICRVERTKKSGYVGITVDALDSLFVLANGCVVHNCQDLTDLQWAVCNVAFADAKKVYCAGDDFQCQRKEDKVLTRDGYKQIQDVTDNDCLISFDIKHQEFKGFKSAEYHPQIARRPFKGDLITVSNEKKEEASFTPEHKLLVRFDYSNTNIRCVYLMKKGAWYRIGQCQIFNAQGTLHLGTRMRQEKADACWILRICTTHQEARNWEAIYSYGFGIPQMSWKFWTTAGDINKVYDSLPDLVSNVEKLLVSVGKYIEFPLLTDERLKERKGGTPLTLCEAVNLCPEIMKLPVYKPDTKTVDWQSFSVGKNFYNDFVYSMNVPVHHTYITNGGIVSHNCVFSYAGANPQVLIDLAKVSKTEKLEISHRLPTSVYRLAKKITDNIEVKIDKDYRPKDFAKKGNIKFLPDLLSLYPFLKNQAEGDWYILTRNTSFQKDVISLLEGLILPYIANDRYFIPSKDWIKIKDFWMFRKEGYKTEEKRDEFLKQYSIKNIYGSMVETQLFDPIKSTLYQAYLDLYGFDKLEEWYTKKKGIVVSNIHRVKGGEAQNVAIIMDCGKKVAEHAFEVPDDELRTLYVAVTRTKENLFFIRSDSNDALDTLLWKCINSGE